MTCLTSDRSDDPTQTPLNEGSSPHPLKTMISPSRSGAWRQTEACDWRLDHGSPAAVRCDRGKRDGAVVSLAY